MAKYKIVSPLSLPIYCFLAAIIAGAIALRQDVCLAQGPLAWEDALFTATSAVCVTGLVVVDTGSFFTIWGQSVILLLIQLGGLGIMTYSSLVFYLWRKRVSLTDRLAVGQNLLHNPAFELGRFLAFMVLMTLGIEALGAAALYAMDPQGFHGFSAVFHAVSAFCNAGFSTYSDSLMHWKADLGVNVVIMTLITVGGMGFSVLHESALVLLHKARLRADSIRLSFHSRIVLQTSLILSMGGAVLLFAMELYSNYQYGVLRSPHLLYEEFLAGVFQSVTCRTAGFNTLDIGSMTNVSLFVMIILMLIGGSPGSCAGGLKTTTFRSIVAFVVSQVRGRQQTVVRNRALDKETMNKALTLFIFGSGTVILATLMLCISEGGDLPHTQLRGQFLEILFEVASAFGTVGLSTGITATLSDFGKSVLIILMFVGRLGPILFISVFQKWQTTPRFGWPEESMMIG